MERTTRTLSRVATAVPLSAAFGTAATVTDRATAVARARDAGLGRPTGRSGRP